jgi:hypothetical protein
MWTTDKNLADTDCSSLFFNQFHSMRIDTHVDSSEKGTYIKRVINKDRGSGVVLYFHIQGPVGLEIA